VERTTETLAVLGKGGLTGTFSDNPRTSTTMGLLILYWSFRSEIPSRGLVIRPF
jgi:hypothetical protein